MSFEEYERSSLRGSGRIGGGGKQVKRCPKVSRRGGSDDPEK